MLETSNGTDWVLEADKLTKKYHGRAVVNEISLHVKQGEIIGILGPNGAGKTTCFYMMLGLVKPESGRVVLAGEDITSLPVYRRARKGVGYLPQETSIFRQLTVEENIMAILEMMPLSKKERKERLERFLAEFRLQHIRRGKGITLSGGERRRTEIARALASSPKFLLLDEPFAGIDPISIEEIQKIILTLRAQGVGVLITDHNVSETLSIVDRAYLVFSGKILKKGKAEEIASDDEVRRLYLGAGFELKRRVQGT